MNKYLRFLFSIGVGLCIVTSACDSRSNNQYLIATNIRAGQAFFTNFRLEAIGIDGLGKVSYNFPKELGYQPNWSPDGKWIVTRVGGRGAGRNADLLFVRSNRNYRYRLITSDQDEVDPSWSPDGKWVIYGSGYDIYSMNVTCILQTQECQPSPIHVAEGRWSDWSPNGENIAFADLACNHQYLPNGPLKTTCTGGIFIIRSDVSNKPVQITPDEQECLQPQWSPDGQQIVASCKDGITLLSPDGSTIESIGVTGGQPRWFPDGSKIIFISSEGEGLGYMVGWEACYASALFTVNPDGSDLQRLTHGEDECILEYTWLPSIVPSK